MQFALVSRLGWVCMAVFDFFLSFQLMTRFLACPVLILFLFVLLHLIIIFEVDLFNILFEDQACTCSVALFFLSLFFPACVLCCWRMYFLHPVFSLAPCSLQCEAGLSFFPWVGLCCCWRGAIGAWGLQVRIEVRIFWFSRCRSWGRIHLWRFLPDQLSEVVCTAFHSFTSLSWSLPHRKWWEEATLDLVTLHQLTQVAAVWPKVSPISAPLVTGRGKRSSHDPDFKKRRSGLIIRPTTRTMVVMRTGVSILVVGRCVGKQNNVLGLYQRSK